MKPYLRMLVIFMISQSFIIRHEFLKVVVMHHLYHDLLKLLIRYPTAIQGKVIECTFANHLSIDESVSVGYSCDHSYYSSSGYGGKNSCGNKCEQFNIDYFVLLTNFSIYSNSGLLTRIFDTIGENLRNNSTILEIYTSNENLQKNKSLLMNGYYASTNDIVVSVL